MRFLWFWLLGICGLLYGDSSLIVNDINVRGLEERLLHVGKALGLRNTWEVSFTSNELRWAVKNMLGEVDIGLQPHEKGLTGGVIAGLPGRRWGMLSQCSWVKNDLFSKGINYFSKESEIHMDRKESGGRNALWGLQYIDAIVGVQSNIVRKVFMNVQMISAIHIANISQNYHEDFEKDRLVLNKTGYFQQQFVGKGIRYGLNSQVCLKNNGYLYADYFVSALWGRPLLSTVDKQSVSVSNIEDTNVHYVRTIRYGIKYDRWINNNSNHMVINIGWERTFWPFHHVLNVLENFSNHYIMLRGCTASLYMDF